MTEIHKSKPLETKGTGSDLDPSTPHARRAPLMGADHDQLDEGKNRAASRQEALVDEAVDESFPASDPASPKQIT
jgi:hypothetical protein